MNLSELTAKFVGRPYSQYSCMGLVHAFYSQLGVNLPNSYGYLTLNNFMGYYFKNPGKTQVEMIKVVNSLGEQSSAQYPKLLDLLIVAQNLRVRHVISPGLLAAIYVGKGHAMTSFLKTGVSVFRLDKHNRAIASRRIV